MMSEIVYHGNVTGLSNDLLPTLNTLKAGKPLFNKMGLDPDMCCRRCSSYLIVQIMLSDQTGAKCASNWAASARDRVIADTKICPPCPASDIRDARLTIRPR